MTEENKKIDAEVIAPEFQEEEVVYEDTPENPAAFEEAQFTEAEGAPAEEAPEVLVQVNLQVMNNGRINIELPEGFENTSERDVESITKEVYENLYEQRIATTAIEILKAKLG